MKTNIIRIGNSRGIRIPKPLLEESGLTDTVELRAKKGEIKIIATKKPDQTDSSSAFLSEPILAKDWSKPEEDEAWTNL